VALAEGRSVTETSAVANAWERWWWAWQVAPATVFGVVAVTSWGDLDGGNRTRLVALLAVEALALAGLSRRRTTWNVALLLVTFAGWFGLVGLAGAFWPTVGFLFALCFSRLELRLALGLTAVLTGFEVARLVRDGDGGAGAVGLFGLTYLASVLVGTWIHRVIEQSKTRAEVIEQLEATREELASSERRAGALEERVRLTGEIHDTLAQGFTSIVMLLQAAAACLPSDPAAAAALVDKAEGSARENLAEARSLVACDPPPALDGATLAGAVDRLAQRVGGELSIPVRPRVEGEPRTLDRALEVALLRAAQEGLANVAKHAHASEVLLTLAYAEGSTAVVVADDGCGFDPATAAAGFGLPGMRARLGSLGGHVDVRSAPGQGTTLAVEVPA